MTRPTRPPVAVILDWDNTLIDSWTVIREALNHTLVTYGLEPWSLEETRQRVQKSMKDSFPGLFGDQWEEAGKVFYDRFEALHTEHLTPLPGAESLLAMLHERGVHIGIVSNKKGPLLRRESEILGWNRFLAQVIGAGDAPEDKPAPHPVDLAMVGSGIDDRAAVWFAGDSEVDLLCARNARCIPILVRDTPPTKGEFLSAPPALHVADCEALFKFTLKLYAA